MQSTSLRTQVGFVLALALILVLLPAAVIAGSPVSLLVAPDTPDATLLVHLDATDIDGTGTQTGDICPRTDTTWSDLSGNGTDGILTNFTLPCTADEGWKGDGSIAESYRLQFDGDLNSGNQVAFSLDSPQSLNFWFYDDPDIELGYADTLFSHGTNSGNYSSVQLQNAMLEVGYNGGTTQHTGFSIEAWHMLTIVNDGGTTYYYLDNVEFANESGSTSSTSTTAYLGVNNSGQRAFDGSIAGFRAYSDALTRSEITDLYQQERYRYEADPGGLAIDRIQDAFDNTAGGKVVTIYGQHFESPVTEVTFDDEPGINITLLDQGRISVETPAQLAAGYVDVTVTSGSTGSDTRPGAFYYTDTPVDNLQIWLDAGNNDAAGDKGATSETNPWANLLYGPDGGLVNIDLPSTDDEGWKGSGPADPYRLQFNGDGSLALADAVYYYIDSPHSINVWFNIEELPEAQASIFQDLSTGTAGMWVQPDGDLVFNYNGESVFVAQPMTLNEWHMGTIFNDGTTTHYYLDNEEITTEANTPSTSAAVGTLGAQADGMEKGINGSICDFRVYEDALTVEEIDTLFHEKRNCYAASRPVSVGSLVWHDLDADGQQDDGEPGIADAIVRLLDGNGELVFDADGVLVADQITGSDGNYSFTNLLPGDYIVEVTPPADQNLFATSTPVDPDPDTNPSNSDSNGVDICEPGSTTPVIIDDGDAEFSQNGFTLITSQGGYQGDIHYTTGGTGGDMATWAFSALPPAQYQVMATWVEGSSRATDAPYTIRDTVIDVNQEQAPDDLFDDGAFWEELGIYTVSYGDLDVKLSNDANNYVIADAIRLSPWAPTCDGTVRSPLFTLTTGDQPVDEQFADGMDDQDGEPDSDGNMTVDFGFQSKVAIGNIVWNDMNDNSIKDDDEGGIEGIGVRLFLDSNGNGICEPDTDLAAGSDTTTAGGGFYQFLDLSPSTAGDPTTYYCVGVSSQDLKDIWGFDRSSTGGAHHPDDTGDHDVAGGDDGVPSGNWIVSQPFAATSLGQTTDDTGNPSDYPDESAYMTVDFGVFSGGQTSVSLASMQASGSGSTTVPTLIGLLVLVVLVACATWMRQRRQAP